MSIFGGVISVSGVSFLMFSVFVIAALGYLLGRITIKGISLGTAGVFIVALLYGALFYDKLAAALTSNDVTYVSNGLKIVENLGLAGVPMPQAVVKALEQLQKRGITIPLFGMVKDDHHRTRALITAEGQEFGISATPAVFALIGRIQEETHRFAITFHRTLRSKGMRKSSLEGIPGVGPAREKALLKHFGTVRAIMQADVEQLTAVLPIQTAQAVYDHFKEKRQ